MYKVKICGLQNGDCADVLNQLTPDYVGYILSEGFSRSISLDKAEGISQALSGKIKRVGVFVNEKIDRVVCAVERGIADLVQLHGCEDEGYVKELKRQCGAQVIKALSLNAAINGEYPQSCDFLLVDSTPRGTFYTAPVEYKSYPQIKKPFFIAGGLTPQNVAQRLKAINAAGADCSGGVETDGRKDGQKIRDFILNVRNLQGSNNNE